MQTEPRIEEAARALRDARRLRRPIAPISQTYGLETVEAAYAVATLNANARIAAGRRLSGRKIGLTAKSVQRQLGVDQPDFGVLFDDMELLDGASAPTERLIQPKVEAEIAFAVAREVAGRGKPSWSEFLGAIDYALPAIEIVDSAIADWKITIVDTIADNASSGLYVLGHQPMAIGAVQLASVEMELRLNGETVSRGEGRACLDHPLRAAYWLACAAAERAEPMRAGEIILSGALGPTAAVKSGDRVEADFGSFGRVSCSFQ